jgi:ATP-dependent helicase/nuclease subunit A
MNQVAADIRERRLALELGRSFCVQAPAGSGKTELLTQRYLSLLATCEHPEEILAITFTRKAAAEMRNRILENMSQASTLSAADISVMPEHRRFTLELTQQVLARDADQQWHLMDNSTRLRISTIDSFNAFLCTQLPVVSELGVMPDIVDDPSVLYEAAILDLFTEVEGETPLADALATLLTHVNNQWRTLSSLLSAMLGKRDQWLANILDIKAHPENTRAILEHTLTQLVNEKLGALRQTLIPYEGDLLPLLNFAASFLASQGNTALDNILENDWLPPATADNLDNWQEICRLLLTNEHKPRRQLDKRTGFPAANGATNKTDQLLRKEMKEAMLALLQTMAEDATLVGLFEEFRHLPAPRYSDSQWHVLESLTIILPELVSRLSLAFRAFGQADHTQVSIAALSALGTDEAPTDLALRLDYRLKHVLVDEFQDTSTLQIRLLQKLTFGWQPGDGRTLFIVGDGMQSCYGFRNANVGLFLAARDNGIGQVTLDSLRLRVNFRSQANIVDWVNRHFAPAFPREDDIGRGGVSFSKADSINDALPGLGVSLLLLTAENDMEDARNLLRRHEAERVADAIASLQTTNPGDRIALLVRTRNHLADIIPALRRRDISWHAADIDPLDSYPVIQDLLVLLRALLNPADVTAWYALLRSPWMGLPLTDILLLSRHARRVETSPWRALQEFENVSGLSQDTCDIIQRVLPVLKLARSERRRLPLREWLEKTWLALGGPVALVDDHLLVSIKHFLDLVQEFDDQGDITDIHRFENKVASQFADGLNPLATLTIMTIHKAKGLEFEHVILPGLERQPRTDENPLLRWREHVSVSGNPELVMSMPAQRGQERDATYQHLKYEAAIQHRLEYTRLFYIGVTRAIKSALLIGSITGRDDAWQAPDTNSLLSALWPQLDADPSVLATLEAVTEVDTGNAVPQSNHQLVINRLPPTWQPPPLLKIARPLEEAEPAEIELPETVHDNLVERTLGDILHECFCRIGKGDLNIHDDNALARCEAAWRKRLAPLTPTPDQAIAEIHRQLSQCRDHEAFLWLMQTDHREATCELSLSDYRNGLQRIAVVDRTFVDADEVRWIIDFKSAKPATGEDEQNFLARLAAQYHPQLARYADLFRAIESRPICTALYFTALPCLHVLDQPAAGND